jgi:hypothetical protein
VAVVVVGVAPHQGGMESIPQGKEPQVKTFRASGAQRCETSWETLGMPGTSWPSHDGQDGPSLASRMPRGVACPVLRALGGDVSQQCGNAPSFDPMCTTCSTCGLRLR